MFQQSVSRRAVTATLTVAALVLAACGNDGEVSAEVTVPAPTALSIVRLDTPEAQLLSEIYARALEGNGYRVIRRSPAKDLAEAYERVKRGEADMMVTTTVALYDVLQADEATPATFVDGANLTDQINAIGEIIDEGVTALPPASAIRSGFISCTSALGEEKTLSNLSGLGRIAGEVTLGATETFQGDGEFSLAAFTELYGGEFEKVETLSEEEIATKLKAGEIDCGAFDSIDNSVPSEGVVLLTDDLGLVPRDAVIPVTKDGDKMVGAVQALNSVSQAFTTEAYISLMSAIKTLDLAPPVLAGRFLESAQLAKVTSD